MKGTAACSVHIWFTSELTQMTSMLCMHLHLHGPYMIRSPKSWKVYHKHKLGDLFWSFLYRVPLMISMFWRNQGRFLKSNPEPQKWWFPNGISFSTSWLNTLGDLCIIENHLKIKLAIPNLQAKHASTSCPNWILTCWLRHWSTKTCPLRTTKKISWHFNNPAKTQHFPECEPY